MDNKDDNVFLWLEPIDEKLDNTHNWQAIRKKDGSYYLIPEFSKSDDVFEYISFKKSTLNNRNPLQISINNPKHIINYEFK